MPMFLGYGFIPIGYKAFFSTTTFLGIFSLLLIELSFLAYKFSEKKIFVLYIFLFLNLMLKAQTRAALLGLILVVFTYLLLSFKRVRAFTWKLSKIILVTLLIGFIIIYPNLEKFSWYPKLAELVYSMTGKILMSGRNNIWIYAVDLIKNRAIFGYGFSAFSIFNISPHNSYIGITLQSGLFGLATVILFINSIFNLMHKCRKDPIVKSCTCFFIGNLTVSAFEVMLFQGQLALSLFLWLIVAIGINRVLNLQRSNANEI
ncbi:O-antigen ligase family protein [Tissierella pigra]|nr:O-antigen ligase family protein [Tissierella pigra]